MMTHYRKAALALCLAALYTLAAAKPEPKRQNIEQMISNEIPVTANDQQTSNLNKRYPRVISIFESLNALTEKKTTNDKDEEKENTSDEEESEKDEYTMHGFKDFFSLQDLENGVYATLLTLFPAKFGPIIGAIRQCHLSQLADAYYHDLAQIKEGKSALFNALMATDKPILTPHQFLYLPKTSEEQALELATKAAIRNACNLSKIASENKAQRDPTAAKLYEQYRFDGIALCPDHRWLLAVKNEPKGLVVIYPLSSKMQSWMRPIAFTVEERVPFFGFLGIEKKGGSFGKKKIKINLCLGNRKYKLINTPTSKQEPMQDIQAYAKFAKNNKKKNQPNFQKYVWKKINAFRKDAVQVQPSTHPLLIDKALIKNDTNGSGVAVQNLDRPVFSRYADDRYAFFCVDNEDAYNLLAVTKKGILKIKLEGISAILAMDLYEHRFKETTKGPKVDEKVLADQPSVLFVLQEGQLVMVHVGIVDCKPEKATYMAVAKHIAKYSCVLKQPLLKNPTTLAVVAHPELTIARGTIASAKKGKKKKKQTPLSSHHRLAVGLDDGSVLIYSWCYQNYTAKKGFSKDTVHLIPCLVLPAPMAITHLVASQKTGRLFVGGQREKGNQYGQRKNDVTFSRVLSLRQVNNNSTTSMIDVYDLRLLDEKCFVASFDNKNRVLQGLAVADSDKGQQVIILNKNEPLLSWNIEIQKDEDDSKQDDNDLPTTDFETDEEPSQLKKQPELTADLNINAILEQDTEMSVSKSKTAPNNLHTDEQDDEKEDNDDINDGYGTEGFSE